MVYLGVRLYFTRSCVPPLNITAFCSNSALYFIKNADEARLSQSSLVESIDLGCPLVAFAYAPSKEAIVVTLDVTRFSEKPESRPKTSVALLEWKNDTVSGPLFGVNFNASFGLIYSHSGQSWKFVQSNDAGNSDSLLWQLVALRVEGPSFWSSLWRLNSIWSY